MVLVVDLVMGFPTKVAVAMSTLMMGVVGLACLGVYIEKGLINGQLIGPVVLGVLLGAFLGAKTLLRIKGQMVRIIFLCALAILSFRTIQNGFMAGR